MPEGSQIRRYEIELLAAYLFREGTLGPEQFASERHAMEHVRGIARGCLVAAEAFYEESRDFFRELEVN